MTLRIIGGLFVILSCSFVGYNFSRNYHTELNYLRDLIWTLDYMERELKYRFTPLPELCQIVYKEHPCRITGVFSRLSELLSSQTLNSVQKSMEVAISDTNIASKKINQLLLNLSKTLGKFDISGEIKSIQSVKEESIAILNLLSVNQKEKVRSMRTIGICTGIAIAILLI